MPLLLDRWTRAVIRFRFAVLVGWLALAILGAVAASQLPPLLSISLTVPGTGSARADAILARHFGENPEGTFTVVFRGQGTPATRRALSARLAAAARAIPAARSSRVRDSEGIVYGTIVTPFDLQRAQSYTPHLRHALAGHSPPAYVTGEPALQYDLNPLLAADLRRGESIAIPIAFLILALVLGIRWLLVVPLVFAAATITVSLGIVFLLAHLILMVSYVPNLVELVGLGLAIDYSLLFSHRFQEEIARGEGPVSDAVLRTTGTAGRTILFSATAVAVSLAVVLIIPIPFIRSMGIAGVIVPIVSLAAAVTIQPALLSLIGRRGLHGLHWRAFGPPADQEGIWTRLARVVLRRRVAVAGVVVVILAGLIWPITRLQLTPGSLTTIPRTTESSRGLAILSNHVGPGAMTPLEIVYEVGSAGRKPVNAAVLRLARRLLLDRAVFVVAIGTRPPYVTADARYGRIVVSPHRAFGDEETQNLVQRVRRRYIPAARFPSGVHVWTGGAPAEGVDFLDRVYGTFPWIILLVLALAYVVLLRAFRSILLPFLALSLDIVSVAATYGMLVVVFQLGLGARALGLYQTAQIEGWVPVFLFATLFGLSMDYQVFLVMRMREAWDSGIESDTAIFHGLQRTGRIVSAAAVIMVASFSGFLAGRIAGLQELGAGLAFGVLLDATVVRLLLMPSLMALLGRWSWWLPAPIAALTRVEASPLAKRRGRGLSRSA